MDSTNQSSNSSSNSELSIVSNMTFDTDSSESIEMEMEMNFIEFCKSFLISAEYQNAKLGGLSNTAKMISSIVNTVPYIGGPLKKLTEMADEIINKNNKLALSHAVTSGQPLSEQEFEEKFRKILLQAATEIWFAFELHLKWVYRKVRNSRSPLQGIQKLGQFAGIRCFKYLVKTAQVDNVHLALVDPDHVGLDDVITAKYNQLTVDSLRMEWPGQEKIKLSAAKFFLYPRPALSPTLKNLVKRGIDNDNDKAVLVRREEAAKFELKLNNDSVEAMTFIKPQFFRRPFLNEQKNHVKETLVPVSVEGIEDEDYFKWVDRSFYADLVYERIKDHVETQLQLMGEPQEPVKSFSSWRRSAGYGASFINHSYGQDAITFNIMSEEPPVEQELTWIKTELKKSRKFASRAGFGGLSVVMDRNEGQKEGKEIVMSNFVRKCYNSYGTEDFARKIWIKANSYELIIEQFKNLAGNIVDWDGKNVDELVDKFYDNIERDHVKTLIVFEDAESPEGNIENGGILNFIRTGTNLNFVVTTKHRDFGCELGWDDFVCCLN